MDFTLVDVGVALVVLVSGVLAYSRGLVRELMAIAGWVGAAILAFIFAKQVEPLIKQVPYLGDWIRDSCQASIILAFAAVFAVALAVISMFTPLFASVVQKSAVGGIDQALGFFFGVLRGLLLATVAYFVYVTVFSEQRVAIIDDSRSAVIFSQLSENIQEQNPEEAMGWLQARYQQLLGDCAAPTDAPEAATE